MVSCMKPMGAVRPLVPKVMTRAVNKLKMRSKTDEVASGWLVNITKLARRASGIGPIRFLVKNRS